MAASNFLRWPTHPKTAGLRLTVLWVTSVFYQTQDPSVDEANSSLLGSVKTHSYPTPPTSLNSWPCGSATTLKIEQPLSVGLKFQRQLFFASSAVCPALLDRSALGRFGWFSAD